MKEREQERQIVFREGFDPGVIEGLMENYRESTSALFELVDNAVDNRIDGKQLQVKVNVRSNTISVANRGGYGLDEAGLHEFFRWGNRRERRGKRIGKHGQGGKAAMGYLGDSMTVTCSAEGSDTALTISDPNWRDRSEGLKEYTATEAKAITDEGYFTVRINKVRRRVNPQTLAERLSETYRPLLMSQDGNPSAVQMTLNDEEIKPMEVDLTEQGVHTLHTDSGSFQLFVGIMAPGQEHVAPGVRTYYSGRLIDKPLFFGHPDPSNVRGMSRLFAEADLESLNIPIDLNKTTFDQSSAEWEDASKAIHQALIDEGWIKKLKELKVETGHTPKKEELDLAQRLKREFEDFLHLTRFLTKPDLPGSSTGRKPPERPRPPRKPPKGGTHKSSEGVTPPALDAIDGKDKVKRWGPFDSWEPRSLGNTKIRAVISEINDKHALYINTDYKPYQRALKEGLGALDQYYIQTIAMEIGKQVKGEASIDEYYNFINEMVREFTEYREQRNHPKGPTVVFQSRT